jgi:phytoene dehydrogenase-like protein
MGNQPGTGMFALLNELGVSRPSLYAEMKEYGRFIHEPSGQSLVISSDLVELAAHLKTLAPADAGKIDEIFKGARALRGRDLTTVGMSSPPELSSLYHRLRETLQMLPIARYFYGRYSQKMSVFVEQLQTPWLKDFFCNLFLPESPVWFVMMCLAIVADKQAAYLSEGCLSFALEIEKRYKALGGNINYQSTVGSITVKDNRAVGLQLVDGQQFPVDYIISCGDSYNTIFNLLKGRYTNQNIQQRFAKWPLCRPFLTVSLGVKREFPNDQTYNTILLKEPVGIGHELINTLFIRIFNYSPHFAPAGKSVFQIEVETEFDYWDNLQKTDRKAYDRCKSELAKALLGRVEKHYPGIPGQVELIDVATPYTTWRYTLNRRASWGGWLLGADNILQPIERRLPGLANLYLAGHWVLGGVPGVLYSGRHAVQLMCHDERQSFTAKTD